MKKMPNLKLSCLPIPCPVRISCQLSPKTNKNTSMNSFGNRKKKTIVFLSGTLDTNEEASIKGKAG